MAGEVEERMVCIAAVATAHGVRGHVKLKTFTEQPDSVTAYGPLFDEAGERRFAIRLVSAIKDGVVVEIDGIKDRNAAERLRGTRLYVPRSALPEPDEEEFYYEDLVGLEARDRAGQVLGRVAAVMDFGGGDIIEVATADGATLSLPFTRAVVPVVDVAGGHVVVEPPAEVE